MIEKVCRKIDDLKHPKKIVGAFLLTWLIINVFQSIFTELAHDEAYYWLYSNKLSWGYFDHPPMIALLIKIGYSVFANELGVRLLPMFMGTATIYIVYLLLKDKLKSLSTFLILISSVIILKSHVGGFLAIPDVPVIFFSALFFLGYKSYVKEDTYTGALFLGLVATAMLYSKYHGVLVLFFTLISNLNLFKRKTFYLIPLVVIVGMLPHLMWQMSNNFPTFEYHLVSRSSDYKVIFTLNYLLGQFLIAGPLVGVLLFVFAYKQRHNGNVFVKAMQYNFFGFFIFFFFMSFKGNVEAHWTAIGFIPAVVLSVDGIYSNLKAREWLHKLFIPTVVLFLIVRVLLVVHIIPHKYVVGSEFHNWDTWTEEIKEKADGRLVVFSGTFQRPAKYSFYTGGEFAHSLNQVWYRKNQYDLWGYTDSIRGKDIALFRGGYSKDSVHTSTSESYTVRYIDNFQFYDHLPVLIEEDVLEGQVSDTSTINVRLVNPTNDSIDLRKQNHLSPRFYLSFYNGEKFSEHRKLPFIDMVLAPSDTVEYKMEFKNPKEEGVYSCYVGIVNNSLWPGFNGKPFQLKVED